MKTLKDLIRSHERTAPFPYLDTNGFVTIGVGHLLPTLSAARLLPWYVDHSNTPFPETFGVDYVGDAWKALTQAPKAHAASFYAPLTKIRLSDAIIDALLAADIAEKQSQLRHVFPTFDTFPVPAQHALTDLAFQVGVSGLVHGFPHLVMEAHEQNWHGCALESHRTQSSDERNATTRQLFEAAATGKVSA